MKLESRQSLVRIIPNEDLRSNPIPRSQFPKPKKKRSPFPWGAFFAYGFVACFILPIAFFIFWALGPFYGIAAIVYFFVRYNSSAG
jgi:hypothetical protein